VAIVVVTEIPGGSAEQDDALMGMLGPAPAGIILRAAGPVEGGWRIIGVWESREAFDTFLRERMDPLLEAAGGDKPDFELAELHSLRTPERWT
jgi:hypothetical protein